LAILAGGRGREGRPQHLLCQPCRDRSRSGQAEREGQLRERIRFLCRPSLLIVNEIGYLPAIQGGGNLFFQLVNARYERGAMILTSNRGFAEWGEVFGDPVAATALLDRLLHHAVVIQIEGSSLRPSSARRPHAGECSHQSLHQPRNPGTAAATPRSTAKKWRFRSRYRLITPLQLGNFTSALLGTFESARRRPSNS
jgi:hypothetical protein